jgi:penicillin amidase
VTVSIDAAALAAALPAGSGDLKIPGLAAKVTVHRDAWGIPHIKAVTEADAYFALGFVHAQDRLFQMELTRRRALGRAAEWLGAEAAESDILVRRLGMEAACRRDHAALGQDAQAMLASYTAGVNAFISSGAPQAIEYTLLETAPEPWEPWHSIAVMRRLGLLMGSVWFKLWRMLALPIVGAAETAGLRYDDGGKDLLTIPTGATADRWQADLAALAPSVKSLLLAMGSETGGDETGGGSNNWAVGPAQSATGRPVLAGDPHRVFEIPGMYTQHHLACDRFDMIGLTVPACPASRISATTITSPTASPTRSWTFTTYSWSSSTPPAPGPGSLKPGNPSPSDRTASMSAVARPGTSTSSQLATARSSLATPNPARRSPCALCSSRKPISRSTACRAWSGPGPSPSCSPTAKAGA